MNIKYLWQIVIHNEEYWQKIERLGTTASNEIKIFLEKNGLFFDMQTFNLTKH